MTDYPAFCEKLFRSWLSGDLVIESVLSKLFQLDYVPEPYLLFGDQQNPLYAFTTNPGDGQEFQHRDAVLNDSSPTVSRLASYADVACRLGEFYPVYLRERNLYGAARRIDRVVELALLTGFSGVVQIEPLPF